MTHKQAHDMLLAAGARLTHLRHRHKVEHRGGVCICALIVYEMPFSRAAVSIIETPATHGWQLGPDSLLEQNMATNAERVAKALDDEEVAKVLELCP